MAEFESFGKGRSAGNGWLVVTINRFSSVIEIEVVIVLSA